MGPPHFHYRVTYNQNQIEDETPTQLTHMTNPSCAKSLSLGMAHFPRALMAPAGDHYRIAKTKSPLFSLVVFHDLQCNA